MLSTRERWKDLSEITITFQEIKDLRPQSNQFRSAVSVKNWTAVMPAVDLAGPSWLPFSTENWEMFALIRFKFHPCKPNRTKTQKLATCTKIWIFNKVDVKNKASKMRIGFNENNNF